MKKKYSKNKLSKELLIELLSNTKEDANFWIYDFSSKKEGKSTYRSKKVLKSEIEILLNTCNEIYLEGEALKDVILVDEYTGVKINDFYENQMYETTNTDGYIEHISKYNKYYNVFIKFEKDADKKTISFKLGKKERTLELVEDTEYVAKVFDYKRKIKCVSAEDLEKHCFDEFWNPMMIELGRRILGIA